MLLARLADQDRLLERVEGLLKRAAQQLVDARVELAHVLVAVLQLGLFVGQLGQHLEDAVGGALGGGNEFPVDALHDLSHVLVFGEFAKCEAQLVALVVVHESLQELEQKLLALVVAQLVLELLHAVELFPGLEAKG